MSLESYFDTTYREDKRQLAEVLKTIHEVVLTFQRTARDVDVKSGDGKKEKVPRATWGYEVDKGFVRANESIHEDKISVSTHSMILFVLDALEGKIEKSSLIPRRLKKFKLKYESKSDKNDFDGLEETVKRGRRALMGPICSASNGWQPESKTYGKCDPLTMTWYVELAGNTLNLVKDFPKNGDVEKGINRIFDAAKSALRKRIEPIQEQQSSKVESKKKPESEKGKPGPKSSFFRFDPNDCLTRSETDHPFVRLRYRHLLAMMEKLGKLDVTLRKEELADHAPTAWFEKTLHDHLAYSGIGDPRFDPAQLVFAMEGMLLSDVHSLHRDAVRHVFDVLAKYQEHDACWRPVVPFIGTERGLALFPLSVEIANSILRCCEILDERELAPFHFSKFEPHLHRYVSWLLARLERFNIVDDSSQKQVAGWHSDHVHKPGTIHLWQTSQVLLFLAHYASLLQRKIAADGLAAANVTPKSYTSIDDVPTFWHEEPLTIANSNGGRDYNVLSTISHKYIQARGQGSKVKPQFSFMLYGPPGTGKTTVAEQMAVRLKWPLITITVSDFLAQGAAAMEARAKMLFKVLCEQEDVVILFDEIDQFLLDRNSQWYQKQDDVFKFMTPGMLTKLQDLRDAKKCIFVLATNYYERIDGAIKRRGRIDDHFLLSLPDWERRCYFLAKFLIDDANKSVGKGKLFELAKKAHETYNDRDAKPESQYEEIKASATHIKGELEKAGIHRNTPLYGYGDLKKLMPSIKDLDENTDAAKLATIIQDQLKQVDPSVELKAYRGRFGEKAGSSTSEEMPFEEFSLLIYLYSDVGVRKGKISSPDVKAVDKAFGNDADERVNLEGHVKCDNATTKIREFFAADS